MPQTIGSGCDVLGAFFSRDIRGEGLGDSTAFGDLTYHLPGFVAQDVYHQHAGTLAGKLQTSMVPDSGTTSGYDCDLIFIFEPHPNSPHIRGSILRQ